MAGRDRVPAGSKGSIARAMPRSDDRKPVGTGRDSDFVRHRPRQPSSTVAEGVPVRSGCCFVGHLDSKRGQGPRRDFTVRLDVRGLAFFGFAAFGGQPACGTNGGSGFVTEAGTQQAAPGGSFGGDAGGTSPLEAHVQSADHRPVTIVTLRCAGSWAWTSRRSPRAAARPTRSHGKPARRGRRVTSPRRRRPSPR